MAFDAVQGNMQAWQSDGDEFRSVAQEVRDQQEAIEALMDMLEKTITVEVSSTLRSEAAVPCVSDW